MSEVAVGALFAILLFAGSLGLIAVGRTVRIRDQALHGTAAGAGLGPVESGVFALLGIAILGSSLLAGYSMGAGPWSWMHAVGFAALLAATVYVIIDLEYPRLGLFQISATDQLLEQLRARL